MISDNFLEMAWRECKLERSLSQGLKGFAGWHMSKSASFPNKVNFWWRKLHLEHLPAAHQPRPNGIYWPWHQKGFCENYKQFEMEPLRESKRSAAHDDRHGTWYWLSHLSVGSELPKVRMGAQDCRFYSNVWGPTAYWSTWRSRQDVSHPESESSRIMEINWRI